MRSRTVDKKDNTELLAQVDLTQTQIEEMYRYMALADYEYNCFVIPTSHREYAGATFDAYSEKSGCGFSFGSGCSTGTSKTNLFRRLQVYHSTRRSD